MTAAPEPPHRILVAALADDAAAPAVLATAAALSTPFATSVEAIHVNDRDEVAHVHASLATLCKQARVPFAVADGSVLAVLMKAASAPGAVGVVVGARGREGGAHPVGSTALALITALSKPVVVVPPGATTTETLRSVLVPLDGSRANAAALDEIVRLSSSAGLEIVAGHVHSAEALPAFGDHLAHEVRVWTDEFMARNLPDAHGRLEVRVGDPDTRLLDLVAASGCQLVAVGWSQRLHGGRAAIVRRLLAQSPVPVLLAPVESAADRRTERAPPSRSRP